MSRVILPFCLVVIGIAAYALSAQGGNTLSDDPYDLTYVRLAKAGMQQDTLPPVKDRYEDFINSKKTNPFDLKDPNNVEKTVEYDPITGRYIIQEKIGDDYFRPPTYMTFDEYMEYRRKQDEDKYFKQLAGIDTGDGVSATDPLAKIDVKNSLIDRLFGGTAVDIRPQGGIDLTFGLDYQKVENPILPIRNQSQLNFDFDMAIQMNVTGKIGEKLSLSTQYNTQSSFNFDNQIKLNYNSDLFSEDEILKKIEAGNVSLPLRGTLIQGAQSLFGIKTEMQFGHLRLTTVLSQQQSQRENIQLQGGSQLQEFEVRADDYDENRHFFLSHYNRDVFEGALTNLPQLKTLFKIENLEVWITNNRNEVENVRDIVALADLGEAEEENLVEPNIISATPDPTRVDISSPPIPLPDNNANDLYRRIEGDPAKRSIDQAVSQLQGLGLQQSKDFEKVSARKLQPSEYTYHPELGFISLNVNVQPDQVVGVSYQYSYNGKIYKVGELAQNQEVTGTRDTAAIAPRDTLSDIKVLFVKMLKSTTQRTDVPTWDLMMKNVYSIGAFNVNPQEFRLDVFYDDPGRGYKRFLSGVSTYATTDTSASAEIDQSAPLLRVFNLDQLNTQGDPQPDGIFDFVPGITINLRNGRVMFPVLEPFGSSLKRKLVDAADEKKFVYQELYDSTIFLAREFPEKNRFLIKGNYKSSVASEISLGAFNIPPGSVRVTAGGQQLIEGSDYEIDYNIGRVRILNDALLSTGVPINVSYEDNTLFNFNNKTMVGLRADYQVDENFNIGATYMHLFERPFTQKVNIGDDPINNRIYGLDLNLTRNAPFLTKLVDAIPGINTKAESKISVTAEAAALRPGHSRAINQNKKDDEGLVYLDDFEGSASSFDLRQPVNQWYLASVPQKAIHPNADTILFREADLINDLRSGANRARLNWYLIDDSRNASVRVRNQQDLVNPYTAIIQQTEVFPNLVQTPDQLPTIQTMSMTYYPRERGPYNFDLPKGYPNYTAGVSFQGDSLVLNDPRSRWGGIMKALQTNDFQAANIEFLEFWVLSPFLNEQNPDLRLSVEEARKREGSLYINLGNISEDILRDSRKFFENGLPAPTNPNRRVDETNWSVVPTGQQITRAFDLEAGSREVQDVGYDGLTDSLENDKFKPFIDAIEMGNPNIANKVRSDPSNDNFRYYRDPSYSDDAGVFQRYRDFNNPQGNSQENDGSQFVSSGTNVPDAEDINRDNTLNETESYFQYRIPFYVNESNTREIDVNRTPYITDVRDTLGRIWYRFRVPLNDPKKQAIGGIRDFRSIRFIRMFMTDFEDQTTLRFATLELVRNQWRTYTKTLTTDSGDIGIDDCEGEAVLNVDAVNIEENSGRKPFNYVLPVDIQREQSLGVFNALQNEQSLSLSVQNLCEGASQAVFKTLNFDMRVYDRLRMYVHAEDGDTLNNIPIPDGALTAFIRLGSDIQENYYEYEIPLTLSKADNITGQNPNSEVYKNEVWRPENYFDIDLKKLVEIKLQRDSSNALRSEEYRDTLYNTIEYSIGNNKTAKIENRAEFVKVRGNPNLGNVKIAMIGIRNRNGDFYSGPFNATIWANELRLSGLDERGGAAAVARVDMQLADLGTVTLAGNISTIGFGALDQKVQERSREGILGYDFATTLELGKFFPERWGLRLPFFAQLSNVTRTPEYDPYDFDVKVNDKYRNTPEVEVVSDGDTTILRKQDVQDITNIRSFNFTNVRKERTGESSGGKPKPWDIENFSVSYAFTETTRRDPIIEFDERKRYTGGLDYAYSRTVKYIEPFKNLVKSDKFLGLLKQFNFNPFPNSFGFSTILDRRFDRTRYRFTGYDTEEQINQYATFYNKRFTWDRDYNLQWDLSRSLKINFDALANAVIDEPEETDLYRDFAQGKITDVDQARRDAIWENMKDLGRTKNYTHNINASYQLPIRYLPFMDWIQARANYQAEYGWNAAALNMVDDAGIFIGNVIRNSQNRQFSADFNFASLYGKINYLKKIDTQQRNQQRNQPGQRTRTRDNQQQADDPNIDNRNRPQKAEKKEGEPSTLEKILIRPLLLLRTARFNYTERFSTTVPGFVPQAGLLGMQDGFAGPGWDFVIGLQPQIKNNFGTNNNWLDRNQNWISKSVYVNQQVVQDYTQTIQAQVTLEPFRDFRVDVDANKNYQETHTQYFKVLKQNEGFQHAIPQEGGSLTLSFFSANTLFKDSREQIIDMFEKFEGNRLVISNRIGTGTHADSVLSDQGYTRGYGRTQQDVLIPAFMAAYTDKDPRTIDLDIFDQIPLPNWRLTYNGLARIPIFQEIFQNFSLSHSYKSTLTLNRFNTGLDYLREVSGVSPGADPSEYDTINQLNNNFYPRLEIPEIVIQEAFSPLLSVSATLKNGMQFNFDYKKSRNLAMSFVNNQLSESRVEEMTFGFGYLLRDVNIGFLTGDKNKKRGGRNRPEQQTPQQQQRPQSNNRSGGSTNLQNRDMDIQFSFSLRDDVTFAHILDQGVIEPTRGAYVLRFSPSAEYKMNRRLSLRVFFDYTRNVPKTSAGFPRTDSSGGVVLRFALN